MKLALVLLFVGAAVASPVQKEKELLDARAVNPGRIVGGVEATPHEFPWMVDMRRPSHYCGGSIISPEWVVTAAHCTQGAPSSYTLVAGDHNIRNPSDNHEQSRTVTAIINHPGYNPSTIENDISLMKVDPPFEFNEWVSAVPLAETGFAPTPMATVSGWGALTEGGGSPDVLMKVDVPYVDDETCNVAYTGDVYESMICYGEGGKDSCQGDSGGPVVCGANQTLCGIVSWGYGCARPGYPGVYTEVSYYREWIRTQTIPTEEDPNPIDTITECGGQVEASSGTISFRPAQLIERGTKCMWVVKTPYDRNRLRLSFSGLTIYDNLYATQFNAGAPGNTIDINALETDFNVTAAMFLVTLDVTTAQARGFNLTFFSSGFGDSSPAPTGFAVLNNSTGSFSYPVGGGQYSNNENALFILSPSTAGARNLAFSRMDVESGSGCQYDKVSAYALSNQTFSLLDSFCGSALRNFTLPEGIGMVTFTTDSSVTGTGFTFNW